MRTQWQRWLMAGALLAFGAAIFAGCAQDVGDIDRTQPDKIKKSLFENEKVWYYRQTVTDVPVQGGAAIWPAYQSSLKKIRWEITEDSLRALSTTDPVEGISDGRQGQDDKQLGAVAIFPIESHFDVQRQYSTATGEPSNVIVENTSDRPWYDREYMRVDWSTNLVDGRGMIGSQLGTLSATTYQPPQKDDHVDPARARISDDYIDVTTEYVFRPNVQRCFQNLGWDSVEFCDAARLRVRNSFVPVDVLNPDDYEPLNYPDAKTVRAGPNNTGDALMTTGYYDDYTRDNRTATNLSMTLECGAQAQYDGDTTSTLEILQRRHGSTFESCTKERFDYFGRFGYFRTRRLKFDRNRPQTDPNKKYMANRWDIWRRAAGDRNPQPVIFHLNAQYPRHMMDAAQEVETQWNETMLEAVALSLRKNADSGDPYDSSTPLQASNDNETDMMDHAREAVRKSQRLGIANTNPMADVKEPEPAKMFRIKKNACHPGPFVTWLERHGSEREADRDNPRALVANAVGSSATGDTLEAALWDMPYEDRVQLCADVEWATAPRDNNRFTYERRGDLRYTLFNWVHEYNLGWSGYGPSSSDPDTGEIVSGAANFAGTPLYESAAYGADLVKYMNGNLNKQEIIYGSHIDRAIRTAQQQQGQALEALNTEDASNSQSEDDRFLRTVDQYDYSQDIKTLADLPEQLQQMGVEEMRRQARQTALSAKTARETTDIWSRAFNKPRIKELMMQDPNFQQQVRLLAQPTQETLENHSGSVAYGDMSEEAQHDAYMDAIKPSRILDQKRNAERWMGKQNMMSADALDRAMTGLVTYRGVAEAFKGMPRAELERYLMEGSFIGTQLHEVGHVMGLRHNFNASMDALNYHDGFWQIREAVIQDEVAEGTRGIENGNGDQQTQYAITDDALIQEIVGEEQAENYEYLSVEEFKQASIMDYTADMTGRFAGLGKYDQAAINFAYGGHVQTWDESDVRLSSTFRTAKFINDYTQLPAIFGSVSTQNASTETQNQLNGIEVILNGREWTPIEQAMEDRRRGIKQTTQDWLSGEYDTGRGQPYIPTSVEYNFCSDRRADYSLGCDTFDHGANHAEVVQHFIDQYRFYQPIWRYRGQKVDPTNQMIGEYQARVQRTMNAATRPFRYYSIYQNLSDYGYDFVEDLRFAGVKGLNFFAEVLAKPAPGTYCRLHASEVPGNPDARNTVDDLDYPQRAPHEDWYYDLSNTFVPNDWLQAQADCPNSVRVPRGPGQYYGFDISNEYGAPVNRVRRVGTYVDKQMAATGLFNISGNWINSSFITDSRATRVSFWTLYRERMVEFIGSTIMGDFTGFGGFVNSNSGPDEPVYRPPQFVDPDSFLGDEGEGGNNDESGDAGEELRSTAPTLLNNVGFGPQVRTLVGSLVMNDSYQDQQVDFSRYVEVAVYPNERPQLGDELPDSEQWSTFTHPITNVTYAAPQLTDGHSISVNLIEWAKRLGNNYEEAVASGSGSSQEGVDPVKRSREQLENVVAKLKLLREMSAMYTDAGE